MPGVLDCCLSRTVHSNLFFASTFANHPHKQTLYEQNKTIYKIGFVGLDTTIPTEIGLLTSLTSLKAELNFLYGTIPTEIGLLSQLQELMLFANSLTGT